ncbi:3-ketosteroid 9alpha-monooxygenase subunit B [Thermomonospora echinospora]|uniref:3-ketosteroid 9alpha-monooxygenase subunit B n=1 Tax=Thermomonospora echinospora TaxID=1992 RepID=A0A1H6E6W6_9ACTN|nr:ferredoxin--NADP reductase [Thermomonospora echinospora]SEG93470.1 3-ketosteroid 9alpha-monooxygenase subunit B [Thermomonospora echinospora]
MTSAGALKARVVEVVRETAEAHSLVLEPAEGDRDRFSYRPGQFLTVRVPAEDGWVARCYSLCSSPVSDDRLKVTVKRVAGGLGSNWICDNVTEGDVLEVLRPAGTFTPASLDEDLLLIAAGSGITPVMSILKSCLAAGAGNVVLLYANRDERSVIFADELRDLAAEHGDRLTVVHWLESVQGLPTAAALRSLARPYAGRETFVCGPEVFMDMAGSALTGLGVPAGRVHIERFFSLAGDPFDPAVPEEGEDADGADGADGSAEGAAEVEVEIDGETRTVPWPRSQRLLDVLLRAGVDAPFSCREGSCAACACVVVEGEAAMDANTVLDAQDLADGLLLACQARPVSDRLKVSYDG